MLIGYKMMAKAMMDMVTTVVHQVVEILEVMVMVVWPAKVEARLCAITVTRQDISLEIVGTQLRHVNIAER